MRKDKHSSCLLGVVDTIQGVWSENVCMCECLWERRYESGVSVRLSGSSETSRKKNCPLSTLLMSRLDGEIKCVKTGVRGVFRGCGDVSEGAGVC